MTGLLVSAPSDIDHSPLQRQEIASYAQLGASIPFCSARLLGTRLRRGPDGRSLEFLLSNPAQGKGNYVLPWQALPEMGSPTLFDLRLWEVLGKIDNIHPAAIRQEAAQIAADGLAGRSAASAAREAIIQEKNSQDHILATALKQIAAVADDFPANGLQPDLAAVFEQCAMSLAGIGLPQVVPPARLRRLKDDIGLMVQEIRACCVNPPAASDTTALIFLADTADVACHYADLAIQEIDDRFSDIINLLTRPRMDLNKILDRLLRPEWLLDGWSVLVALWQSTAPELRHSIAWDLVGLVPPLPTEVHGWFSGAETKTSPPRISRMISQGSDWRTGKLLEITARNENVISFSFNHENRMSPAETLQRRNSSRVKIAKYHATDPKNSPLETHPVSPKQTASSDIKFLAADLRKTTDDNLIRIVSMIDRLPDRSKIDGLLSRARPRLRHLKLPRMVTLTRLLFLPLSGAIVNPTGWMRDPGLIPRTALNPLATLIRDAMGKPAHDIIQSLKDKVFSDTATVGHFGCPLWQGAASIADRITPGSRWAEAGFTPEDFRSFMRLASGVWRHAEALWDILRLGEAPLAESQLRNALSGPAHESPDIFAAAFNTLLRRSQKASQFAPLISGMPPGISEIVIRSLEAWLEEALSLQQDEPLAVAADRVEEIGRTLELLRLAPYFQIPRRRQQISSFFWRLEENCRFRMLQAIDQDILPVLMPAQDPLSDREFAYVEQIARAVKRLELLGRQLGNAPMYHDTLDRVSKAFATAEQHPNGSGMTAIDRIRLAEILLGQQIARSLKLNT